MNHFMKTIPHLQLALLIILANFSITHSINVRVSNLTIGEQSFNLINSNSEDIYKVIYNSTDTTLNVTAWTNASYKLPLLIVIRQENGLISLQLPDKQTARFVQNFTRILCPAYVGQDNKTGLSTVFIDIYTSSKISVSYSIEVNYFKTFVLAESSTTSVMVSPFAPVFYKYPMKSRTARLEFLSNDRICTTVSVQRMICPIFDLRHTVDFSGQYQTMTKKALISVENYEDKIEPIYIVISVHTNDLECCAIPNCSGSDIHRYKNVTLFLKPGFDQSQVNLNYAITLSFFLAIYIFICPFLCFIEPYSEKNFRHLINEFKTNETILSLSTNVSPTPIPSDKICDERAATQIQINKSLEENLLAYKESQKSDSGINNINTNDSTLNNICSINSTREENTMEDINSFSSVIESSNSETYKEIIKEERVIMLTDLSRKQTKLVDRKMMNYPRLIIAIATFYTLPVVQLVFLFQTQLTKSGNEDSCYFNFLCMVKSGPFAAFNNIFSNVGYILLGIMFIIIVKKRAYSYSYMRKKYPKIMATHGVPQHFGLFYTMGIGLIMEGILSAAYHVCPSYNNFQFDTSFMYILGVISTLKLYQCRHPDIHVSSQKVFLFLALCILVNVIGVFYGKGKLWFVILYSIAHVTFFFGLSIVIYNMKNPDLNMKKLKEMANNEAIKKLSEPKYTKRLIMLVIANVFNIGMAVYSILIPTQFSTHLLHLLLGNFLLYFIMYCICKLINGENFHIVTIMNLIVASIAWIFALYFFIIEIKYWEEKPAVSREANRPCILLKVYDHHDAWHFLSALSMFLSFSVQLTLDDGIILKKRNEITVF